MRFVGTCLRCQRTGTLNAAGLCKDRDCKPASGSGYGCAFVVLMVIVIGAVTMQHFVRLATEERTRQIIREELAKDRASK